MLRAYLHRIDHFAENLLWVAKVSLCLWMERLSLLFFLKRKNLDSALLSSSYTVITVSPSVPPRRQAIYTRIAFCTRGRYDLCVGIRVLSNVGFGDKITWSVMVLTPDLLLKISDCEALLTSLALSRLDRDAVLRTVMLTTA